MKSLLKSPPVSRRLAPVLLLAMLPFSGAPVAAAELEGKPAIRTVKRLLVSIRLKKDDKALTYVNLDAMGKYLLGKYHGKFKPGQKQRFEKSLGEYMQLRAFPWARKNIGRVGLSYDKPEIKGNRVHVRSSLVYAGAERITFTWVIGKFDGRYMVTDVLNIKGESSLKASRDRQIIPVYRKRGAEGLLRTMERVVKKLRRG